MTDEEIDSYKKELERIETLPPEEQHQALREYGLKFGQQLCDESDGRFKMDPNSGIISSIEPIRFNHDMFVRYYDDKLYGESVFGSPLDRLIQNTKEKR